MNRLLLICGVSVLLLLAGCSMPGTNQSTPTPTTNETPTTTPTETPQPDFEQTPQENISTQYDHIIGSGSGDTKPHVLNITTNTTSVEIKIRMQLSQNSTVAPVVFNSTLSDNNKSVSVLLRKPTTYIVEVSNMNTSYTIPRQSFDCNYKKHELVITEDGNINSTVYTTKKGC